MLFAAFFISPEKGAVSCKFYALPMDGGAFLYERKKLWILKI